MFVDFLLISKGLEFIFKQCNTLINTTGAISQRLVYIMLWYTLIMIWQNQASSDSCSNYCNPSFEVKLSIPTIIFDCCDLSVFHYKSHNQQYLMGLLLLLLLLLLSKFWSLLLVVSFLFTITLGKSAQKNTQ